MRALIRMEDGAKFLLSYLLSLYLGYEWWVFFAWLLLPDISMAAYLLGPKVGAWLYNTFHHQATGIGVGLIGFYFQQPDLMFSGVVFWS